MTPDTSNSVPSGRRAAALAIAAVAGLLGWLLPAAMSGRAEAWDSSLYWSLGLGIICAGCAIAACVHADRVWRYGLIAMAAQAVAMIARGGIGNLFPIGVVFLRVLALLPIAASRLAVRVFVRPQR